MKKAIVAGAASVALAAMPIVGVFAADPEPVVDTITVTVDETCTLTRTTGNGNYTATLNAGTVNPSVGSATFTAVCNNATGFNITATPTALTGAGEAINYSATTPTAGSGTWTATKTNVAGNIPATGGVLMSATGPTVAAGQTETVTYQVSVRSNQAKGDYSGTMTYTLVQN